MEAQVLKSLGKLKKLLPRNQKELKEVVDAATTKMTAAKERKDTSSEQGGGVGSAVEVPFEPFLLAVLTRQPKLVVVALDCMEKFLAFGFLRGNGSIPESIRKRLVQKYGKRGRESGQAGVNSASGSASGNAAGAGDGSEDSVLNEENWKLIDCIVEVICDTNDHLDETVQIQVLRALLTAVTTPTCEVHEHSLLKAVRACYHIHLVSKSATNQMVAKATLQQITSIVFQRMETFDQRVHEETEATLRASLQKSESTAAAAVSSAGDGDEGRDAEDRSASHDETNGHVSDSQFTRQCLTSVDGSSMVSACWYPTVVKALKITLLKTNEAPHSAGRTKSGSGHTVQSHGRPATAPTALFAPSFPSVLHKDAFLLFRSLCRISMRSVAEDSALGAGGSSSFASNNGNAGNGSSVEDAFAFQSKILSLELVLSIINHAGPSFRRGERFVHAIRQYLCQSLLQNCTSNYTQIVELSLQLFLVLITNFKSHLKAEIEIFVTNIFLRILESNNSSFEHKMLVLEALNTICDDTSLLGEIFLNYDCDWNTVDLFKQLVHAVAKTAKGRPSDVTAQLYANMSSSVRAKQLQHDAALVLKGLECLTATVASLKKAANFVQAETQLLSKKDSHASMDELGDEEPHPPTSAGGSALATPPPSSSSSSAPSMASVVSNAMSTMSVIEAFDRKKRRQEELATGILKFNVKPAAGIQYLVQRGHLGEGTPRDVARFLHDYSDKLDKTEIGDYLGREAQYQNGFCIKVLHEYMDMMDFTGLEIDVAIRHFLAGFRLPGEAQKIDRMMEKFAERFYSTCPPGLFPSADTAFILSFSIILLQTDLHNPGIAEEKRMDKAGFLRNNRGINNGEDLPDAYLGAIFDRIKQSPISLKEDEAIALRQQRGGVLGGSSAFFGASSAMVDRQRRDAYIKERESMVRASEALFRRRTPAAAARSAPFSPRGTPSTTSTSASSSASMSATTGGMPASSSTTFHEISAFAERVHVRPMFEIVWAPLLACSSVIFEGTTSPVAVQLCLDAFKHAIHLAARLDMPSERDAFVTVLAKFTALHTATTRLLRAKNLEAIKALISISVKEGNYLGDAWRDVLQCLSQLARLQTHAQQGGFEHVVQSSSSSFSSSSPSTSNTGSFSNSNGNILGLSGGITSSAGRRTASPSHRDGSNAGGAITGGAGSAEELYNPAIEDENAARVMIEIDALASDRVFSNSVGLSDRAIQEFVLQLCVVSLTECSGVTPNGHGVVMQRQQQQQQQRQEETGGMDGVGAPRVFSLQKLVEVADMNMAVRSRVVWASTWHVLSRHFTTIGCHDNLSIAMYAVDSLRQLSMKFLEKEELKDFNFQRLFLTPFEVIIANASFTDIKELVLRCVENMILARVTNIKSGWKTIWGVLRVAAETYEPAPPPDSDRIVRLGFQIAQRILAQHFERIVDVFVDAVECLLAFAVCGSEDVERGGEELLTLTQIGVTSIELLSGVCLERLATGQVIEMLVSSDNSATAGSAAGAAAKRIAFKKKNMAGETAGVPPSPSGTNSGKTLSPPAPTTPLPASPRPLRYEKQESLRSLEDEVAVMSPRHSVSSRPSKPDASAFAEGILGLPVYTDSALHTRMWWPVLTALSTLASDRRMDVRVTALYALFDSLMRHGQTFSSGLWSLIFKGVLIPLLNELRQVELTQDRPIRRPLHLPSTRARFGHDAFQRLHPRYSSVTICLERMLDTFGHFYEVVGFMPEVLFLLGKCMDAQDDGEYDLAAASAAALQRMLLTHGHRFGDDVWGLIADELRALLTRAEPTWVFFTVPVDGRDGNAVSQAPAPAIDEDKTESTDDTGKSPTVQTGHAPAFLSPTSAVLSPRALALPPPVLGMYASVPTVLRFKFATTFPRKMVTEEAVQSQRIPSRTHLVVLLAVQRLVGHVLVSRVPRNLSLSEGHCASLQRSLRESFAFARRLNDAIPLRRQLARLGWNYGRLHAQEDGNGHDHIAEASQAGGVATNDLPSLIFQEVCGKEAYLRVLFHAITTAGHTETERDDARRQMTALVQQVVGEFLVWSGISLAATERGHMPISQPVDAAQRVVRYVPLMVTVLSQIAQFSADELRRHLSWLYPLLHELIKTRYDDVRAALTLVFAQSVSQLLPLQ